MPNIFDVMAATAFQTTTQVMGYDATWSPSDFPATTHSARVHYNDPNDFGTERVENEHVDYGDKRITIEYWRADFPGLADAANSGKYESITMVCPDGVSRTFNVLRVNEILDGQTYEAHIKQVTP